MKKLLIMMLIGLGGTALIKNGHVTITPDNQIRVAGYAVPLPEAVQNSPLMGMVTTLLLGQLPASPQTAAVASRPGAPVGAPGGAPVRPVLPSITSANSTYNANAPAAHASGAGPAMTTDQFSAVAKALKGSQ